LQTVVRIGVVGLGFGARVHIPGFQLLEPLGARVAAVCSRSGSSAASAPPGARVYRDWRELVTDPDLDLVSVATPPLEHAEISLAALAAGTAVLCEKPLGLDAGQAVAVAEACADGPPALVNFGYRTLPAFRRARELIEAGALGEIERFDATWHVQARDDSGWPWTWKDSAAEGGGALASYGVHALDYLEWLLGPVGSVEATLRPSEAQRPDGRGALRPVTADSALTASLALTGGAGGTLAVVLDSERSMHQIEIAGGRGNLVLENPDPSDPVRPFALFRDGGRVELEPPEWPAPRALDGRVEPFANLAAELIAALRQGRPATPSPLDAARALALMAAVRQAAAEGHPAAPRGLSLTRTGSQDKR